MTSSTPDDVIVNQNPSDSRHLRPFAVPTMPHWSTEDTKCALLASLIPGTKLRKPKWISPNIIKISSVVDVLSVAPVGYASYLCYKNGGGFDYNDTRLALALYGANIAFVATCIPLVKKKNLNCLSRNMLFVHGTALAAAVAFFKIHKPAGYWMVPYALWTGFYLFMVRSIKKENDPVKDL